MQFEKVKTHKRTYKNENSLMLSQQILASDMPESEKIFSFKELLKKTIEEKNGVAINHYKRGLALVYKQNYNKKYFKTKIHGQPKLVNW